MDDYLVGPDGRPKKKTVDERMAEGKSLKDGLSGRMTEKRCRERDQFLRKRNTYNGQPSRSWDDYE